MNETFKKYMEQIVPTNLFSGIINKFVNKGITIDLFKKTMPKTLKILLDARKELKTNLKKSINEDLGLKLLTEEIDSDKNDIVYNESKGLMIHLAVTWVIFILMIAFGEETFTKIHKRMLDKLSDTFDKKD